VTRTPGGRAAGGLPSQRLGRTVDTAAARCQYGCRSGPHRQCSAAAWELTLEFIASLVILSLVMFGLWLISFGLLAPVTLAGYTRSLLRLLREGRDPKLGDLFDDMGKFLPLLLLAVIVTAAVAVGLALQIFPGILISFLVTYVFIYVIPLMVDRELALVPAIQESFSLAMRRPLSDQLLVTVIYMAVISIGSAVFIGALFTQPLATLFLLSVYNQRVR